MMPDGRALRAWRFATWVVRGLGLVVLFLVVLAIALLAMVAGGCSREVEIESTAPELGRIKCVCRDDDGPAVYGSGLAADAFKCIDACAKGGTP